MPTQTEKQAEKPPGSIPANPDAFSRDLEQLSELATLVSAARDALSDEIVTRVSSALSDGITLLDRLTRNEGLMRLIQALDRPDNQYLLMGLADALSKTSRDIASGSPSAGGVGGIMRLAREPGTQEGLRMLSLLGAHLSDSMRELHRRDR